MMMMFDEIALSGDLDVFSAPIVEEDITARQTEPEAIVEEDFSDEDIDVEELERRMWKDKMRLKRLKEQVKPKDGLDAAKQRQSQEQARRKKMSRAQDGILKYMLKMMEVCKAQGFVYGIIPEKGKPVTGASDNLREWWKDKVRFDRNGPAAISNEYDVYGGDDGPNFDVEERKPETLLHASNIGMMDRMRGVRLPIQQSSFAMNGEAVTNMDFMRKRKISSDFNIMMDQKVFTCEYSMCPYSEVRIGFQDRTSRDNHQLNCPYRGTSSDYGGPTFHADEVKPVLFPQSFIQPKPIAQPVNMVVPPSIDLTGLGVSEDGEKNIGDLMTVYDTDVHQDSRNLSSGNRIAPVLNQNIPQPIRIQQQPQPQNFFRSQGMVMEGNLFEETNMSNNNHHHHMFATRDEGQFDRFKALNSPFENNHNHHHNNNNNNNNFHVMFGSPQRDLTSFDFKEDMHHHGHGVSIDPIQKQQDISIWYQ
ncbi:hypothetical protein TSUD_134580 [Trifolium subterraneum]|uniref:Ethylene insensitive 3-like DNA-binding domain-containing protein n=1 Tax=Trifolium subterraneum TaxID=3900 RepID=A0A2Z6P8I7_TRISU|nr:hypothetical protein TSUD_134580 [Trifolium subterraneum]